jgi:tetratricopeptide (TPR) repeat protein
MRHCASHLIVSLLALLAGGCRIPGLRGPVSDSLATSRQLSQQGTAALERGQQQEAEGVLAKAVKACPADPDARRYYAEALWLRGARTEAVAQLEETSRLLPDDATVRVRLAQMYAAMGQLDPARRYAEQAVALNPKLAAAWATRGAVVQTSGELRQALADYHRALGYAPDDRQILIEIAELYRRLNEPQRALETLQTLADTYSSGEEPQQVLYLLGLAYVAQRRYDDGVESLAAAAARDKPTPEILFRLGEAQWLAGRPADAAAALRQALAVDARHQPSRELLTRMEVARQTETVRR